jgi:hypothetical protein
MIDEPGCAEYGDKEPVSYTEKSLRGDYGELLSSWELRTDAVEVNERLIVQAAVQSFLFVMETEIT